MPPQDQLLVSFKEQTGKKKNGGKRSQKNLTHTLRFLTHIVRGIATGFAMVLDAPFG